MIEAEGGWSKKWLKQKVIEAEGGWSRRWLKQKMVEAEDGWSTIWLKQKMVEAECGWNGSLAAVSNWLVQTPLLIAEIRTQSMLMVIFFIRRDKLERVKRIKIIW